MAFIEGGSAGEFFRWTRTITRNRDIEPDSKLLAFVMVSNSGRFGHEMNLPYTVYGAYAELAPDEVAELLNGLVSAGWLTITKPGGIGIAPTFRISFPAGGVS